MEKNQPQRSKTIAGLLSIIPGLGQIYAGYPRRGIALLLIMAVQLGLLLAVKATGLAAWLFLVWVWNINDAICCAARRACSIVIPVFILLLLNFAAGWKETEVDLVALKQGVFGNDAKGIIAGLLQPELIAKSKSLETAYTKYYVKQKPQQLADTGSEKYKISIDKERLLKDEWATVRGRGFSPNNEGMLYLLGGAEIPLEPLETDSQGNFEVKFKNPHDVPGDYWVEARISVPTGGWEASKTLALTFDAMVQTIFMALMGTALSLIVTIPMSFFGARNLTSQIPFGTALYSITRTIFNLLRSVEVIIVAIIMAVIVGIGPFAGVLALAIHGVGALGKLYSEAIESIDPSPVEAVTATGASSLQVVMYGVVPQVVPQFVAFTIYRWDINVRMATVIGLVGGGGIGFLLKQYIDLTQWHQAGTAIWLIAAVVMIMDYASAIIRERIV